MRTLTHSICQEVAAERDRQIDVEGYDACHDASHQNEELARVAAWYALPWSYIGPNLAKILPEGWGFKRHDRRRELVIAAALCVAEIERLDRAGGK